jgi:hypothetical protein
MPRVLASVFLVLHGLVHLLFSAHSQRFFELKPGLTWPDDSWALSKAVGDDATRLITSMALVLAAVLFIAGGTGVLAKQGWWRPVVLGAVAFSSVIYVLLWDGSRQNLDGQGAIGLLINLAIVVAVLI